MNTVGYHDIIKFTVENNMKYCAISDGTDEGEFDFDLHARLRRTTWRYNCQTTGKEWKVFEGEPVKGAQESITGDREAVGGEVYIE